MKIREKIKEAMLLKRIKAVDLACEIGVSNGALSLFLSGKMNLSQTNIERAFEYLGIEICIQY